MESHDFPPDFGRLDSPIVSEHWRVVHQPPTPSTPSTSPPRQHKLNSVGDLSPTLFISQAGVSTLAPQKGQIEKCDHCRKLGLDCSPNSRAETCSVKAAVSMSRELDRPSKLGLSRPWCDHSIRSVDSGVVLDGDFEEPAGYLTLPASAEPPVGILINNETPTPPYSGPSNRDGLKQRAIDIGSSILPCLDGLENCPEWQDDSPHNFVSSSPAPILMTGQELQRSRSRHPLQPPTATKRGGYDLIYSNHIGDLLPVIDIDPATGFEVRSLKMPRCQSLLSVASSNLESAFESPLGSEGELSFIDPGPDDLEDAEMEISDPRWDQLREHFITKFIQSYLEAGQGSFVDAESSSPASGSSSTPKNNENALTSITTPSSAKSLAKRARDNEDNGEEEFRDRRRNEKRQRLSAESVVALRGRLFACPYCKFDPQRYSAENTLEKHYQKCSSHLLTTINRLKQHLYRTHRRPEHYCSSCYEEFEEQALLELHGRRRPPCDIIDSPFAEKMTPDQFKKIKKKGNRGSGQDGTEEWFNIYKILFPGCRLPDSPFVESVSPDAVRHVASIFELRAPVIFAESLRAVIPDSLLLTQAQQGIFEGALGYIVARLVQDMGRDFHLTVLNGSRARQSATSASHAPADGLMMSQWNADAEDRASGFSAAHPTPLLARSSSNASHQIRSENSRGVEPEERNQSLVPQADVFCMHDSRVSFESNQRRDIDTYADLDTSGSLIIPPMIQATSEVSTFNDFDAMFANESFAPLTYLEHLEPNQYARLETTAPTPPPYYAPGGSTGELQRIVPGLNLPKNSPSYCKQVGDFENPPGKRFRKKPRNGF